MPCANCGGLVEITDSTGGTTDGHFTETHECIECGATGTVSGEAGKMPQNWNRYGTVFSE